jgi:hypothetical protein
MSARFDPEYKLPSRQTFTRLLDERFDKLRPELIKKLESIDKFAMTTDGWSAQFTADKYETITLHYQEDGQLKHFVLETLLFQKKGLAVNLAALLRDCLKRWGVLGKIVGCTTDNANVQKGMS